MQQDSLHVIVGGMAGSHGDRASPPGLDQSTSSGRGAGKAYSVSVEVVISSPVGGCVPRASAPPRIPSRLVPGWRD